MRLLLDEMISPQVAKQLLRLGIDAVTARDRGTLGSGDDEQLDDAASERRTIVTYNIADFVALARQYSDDGRAHYGIILISHASIPQRDVGAQVSALASFAARYPSDESLQDQVVFLPHT